jgi:hypothetical protein
MRDQWYSMLFGLLLAIHAGAAAADEKPVEAVDAAAIAATLAEIRDVDHWAHLGDAATGDAGDPVAQAFEKWAKFLTQMSRAGQTQDADRICAAIVELHHHLSEKTIMAPSHTAADAFIRDQFRVGGRTVNVAQFFEPQRYYKDDPSIMKLFRFSVYEGDRVVLRYYLEHSKYGDEDYFVLGKADPSGAHFQVQPYGAHEPSYWTLLRRVVEDMNDRAPHYPASSKPAQ